jgi:hypothetical protein
VNFVVQVGYTSGWISTICKNCYENSDTRISNRKWQLRENSFPDNVQKELRKIKINKLEREE